MSFNNIQTSTSNLNNFKYLNNQSTVLHIEDSNKLDIHGVNVITNTPSVGDVLCITCKTDESGSLLGPDKQDIVWIKGMTINYNTFLTSMYEPVGIVYKVRGRTAYVRYREEPQLYLGRTLRFDVTPNISLLSGRTAEVSIRIYDSTGSEILTTSGSFAGTTVKAFANWLYTTLNIYYGDSTSANNRDVFANYVGSNDEYNYDKLDGKCVLDIKQSDKTQDMIASNIIITNCNVTYHKCAVVPYIDTNITNNGNLQHVIHPINYYKFFDWASVNGDTPTKNITTLFDGKIVNQNAFDNNSYCELLRNTYTTYENYLKSSFMMKWPVSSGSNSAVGTYGDDSRKYNEILSNIKIKCTNTTDWNLYCSIFKTISVNHQLLISSNWCVPTIADMIELMNNVTYDTNEWTTNPDIINQVIIKLNNDNTATHGFKFTPLSANVDRWTCCFGKYDTETGNGIYTYNKVRGEINYNVPEASIGKLSTALITKIEF